MKHLWMKILKYHKDREKKEIESKKKYIWNKKMLIAIFASKTPWPNINLAWLQGRFDKHSTICSKG